MIDKIKELYWDWVPYDWRPGQIWYYLKCLVWLRYSTVKPRYLGHTWCDKTELVPHMMFEMLCQFIEKECSPGHIEWYGEYGHKVTVDGVEKYAMDEMRELATWWTEDYNKKYPDTCDGLWAEAEKHSPTSEHEAIGDDLFELTQKFETEQDERLFKLCMTGLNKLEERMAKELEARLHRIIPLIPSMWT
jgi:hypothetical protein